MWIRVGMVSCFSVCLLTALAAGCGGASVHNESQNPQGASPVSTNLVYVGNFDLGAVTLKSDPGTLTGRPRLLPALRGNQDPAEQVAKLQELLASDIVRDLQRAGIAAQRLDPAAPRPAIGLLVSGEFLDFSEGNRAQKAVIGFGAGDSNAQLYVSLAELSHPEGQNLLTFDADTNPSKAPGGGVTAVATHSPWGIVAKYALSRDASEKDMKHIAQAVSDEIVKYMRGK
jgi:hypothetical protein